MNNALILSSINIEHLLLCYLVIYCVLSLFFKPDKSRIYCGVFAFCGPTNLTKGLYAMILANIKLIGIQNDSRGGDNAGILINGEIIRTKGTEWKFSELLQKNTLENPNPEYSTVIIGHCRKASVGGRDQKYAHPFEIYRNDNENDFYMAGVHNGTISNWKELAENYSIDPSTMDNDSKTLLTILSRQRNLKRKQPIFRVLEQYTGYGVFIWYFADEPNTMYVFKGATRTFENSKTLYEERPLYYYECPITKGIYFSSLKEPLEMIAIEKTKVEQLICNTVFKITEGKFIKKDEVLINRDNVINYTVTRKSKNAFVMGAQTSMYENDYESDDERYAKAYGYNFPQKKESLLDKVFSASSTSKKEEEKKETQQIQIQNIDVTLNIDKDSSTSSSKDFVYISSKFDVPSKSLTELSQQGLIYRNGGLYYCRGKLLTGSFLINKNTYKCYDFNNEEVQKELKDNSQNIETKYFFEGYMVRNAQAYDTLTRIKDNDISSWKTDKTDSYLSYYCTQPVPGIFNKELYYLQGVKADYRLENPPYSEKKIYHFQNGYLDRVLFLKPKNNSEKTISTTPSLIKDPEQLNIMAKELGIPYQRTREEVINNASITKPVEEKFLQENDFMKEENITVIPVEDSYLIDSQEEEILDLYKELCERCSEQMDFLKKYADQKLLDPSHFLSGNFHMFFKDSIEGCLLIPQGGSKMTTPYFEKEGDTLVYKGIKQDVEEFTIF